ncbi:MAG: trypsin-like serine protease [Bdellovibrionales bacterium]|nr:trypsin-like serine protease [Oligoflexia bacterium]
MKLFLCIILFASTVPCHARPPILGGEVVNSTDFIARSVVALIAKSRSGESLCTASLVGPELAITAAHCVSEKGTSLQLFLVFSTDVRTVSPDRIRPVDRVEIPEEWNPSNLKGRDTSDIALLHFSGSLPAAYEPSTLLPFDHAFRKDEIISIAGYGISSALLDSGSGILRKALISVSDPHYSATEIEFDQTSGGGACHGDSGGPAYVVIKGQPYLFGITSRGSEACDEKVIYSTIASYQNWFREAVRLIH